uniref:Uncharacterized protein n=1 Tax=Anguilla anguilla TaxID=7936 RepID=A0A0E9VC18_ANGAN
MFLFMISLHGPSKRSNACTSIIKHLTSPTA